MSYTIKTCLPTAAQWMALRQSVGWATFAPETAEQSLAATPYCVCAFEDGELIGMGRVLGDMVISFYIGNVMVRPDHQGNGIGREIMERIIAHVREVAAPGAIASLLSIKGKEDFYTQFGFEARPDETHGSGMSIRF
jgi:predicted GNAT family N-acyltransferase